MSKRYSLDSHISSFPPDIQKRIRRNVNRTLSLYITGKERDIEVRIAMDSKIGDIFYIINPDYYVALANGVKNPPRGR